MPKPHTFDVEDLLSAPIDHLWASSTGRGGFKRFFIVSDMRSGTVSWAVETPSGRTPFTDVHEAVQAYNET